jgi:glutathione peroxidase
MKKAIFLFGAAILLLSNGVQAQDQSKSQITSNANKKVMKPSIHQFKAETLSGETFDLSTLAGKKVIIVNTASECGFTPQYKELEAIYKRYGKKLVVVGFPTNDFGGQEPGTNKEIATFCEKNYGVTFPMMAKITVKGKQMSPIYQFLTQQEKNGLQDSEVAWNFQKYLINEKGELEKVLPSDVKPDDAQIISWIEGK